ncbi:unnamed protein product [Lasius platythorax]|uniref:Uncharacterized protein n=1 Tax=Lasius platythorax TaxID=488582 RepID=A0AAV2NED2_9HYME
MATATKVQSRFDQNENSPVFEYRRDRMMSSDQRTTPPNDGRQDGRGCCSTGRSGSTGFIAIISCRICDNTRVVFVVSDRYTAIQKFVYALVDFMAFSGNSLEFMAVQCLQNSNASKRFLI